MTRVLAQYMSLETAALGLVELALSFLIIQVVLAVSGGPELLQPAAATASADLTSLAAMLAITTGAVAATIGLYRPDICLEPRRMVANATVAGVIAFPAILLVSGGFHVSLTAHALLWLVGLLVACQAGILLTHLAFSAVVQRSRMVRRVLILGSGRRAARVAEMLRNRRGRLFEPVAPGSTAGSLAAADAPASAETLASAALREGRIWGVIIAEDASAGMPAATLLDSKLRGTRVLSDTAFCEHYLGRIDLDTIDAAWLLCADGFVQGRLTNAIKRGLDLVVSVALLILTLPVMVITALLIRLESPGSVLYCQQRVGLHGKAFTLFKFRSMTVDAERGGKPTWAQQQDPRVTRVGSFIRPMRIDELPQLLNVLRGEMSMIGPRPERPHFVEQLARIIPFYHERAYVKPGITGWAQVNYPYGASVEDAREKLAYDLYYVKNRGVLFDLLILVSTVRVILFREGAR